VKTPPDDIAEKLIAASKKFTGTGLDVSMDEVARAADIPRATLYYYFSGRDDLLRFYLTQKLDTVSVAMQKAAASEGTAVERLSNLIRAVLHAMAAQPAICTELPEALRRSRNGFTELALKADLVMRQPIRDLLIEGRANGEFDVKDVDVAIDSLHGAVGQVAMARITVTGELDADAVADALIPLVMNGLVKPLA
jgi:TetR/AcrR family transcriptional regulator